MKTTITIMRAGQEPEEQTLDLERGPGLDKLREIILPHLDGGQLEQVSVLAGKLMTDMFVDGDGIEKGLPRNEAATEVYRNDTMTRKPRTDPESLPAIHGPAVLFSRRVWF